MTRRFTLLVNPTSAGGRALERLPAVTAEWDRLGVEYTTIQTRSLDHAVELAGSAADEGRTVATLGGDGLVGPVAGALRGRESALAIIPGGRGNDFARVLGIPKEPAAAARSAVEGGERMVDVASVNGVPYVGIASLGFDSECNRIANETRFVRGNLVYLYAALRALIAWRPATFTVTIDGERHVLEGFSVAAANSKAFGGGMFMAPAAELDDGLLDVVTISGEDKLAYLRGVPSVFKGKHVEREQVTVLRGAVIDVESDRQFDVYADGDPIARTPAKMTVERRCLRVVVPG